MDIMPTDIATYPWAVLTAVKFVFTRHVASCIVSVERTVAIKVSVVSVVIAIIVRTGVVVRVNRERLLAALLRRNAEPSGWTLPVASWTGCKTYHKVYVLKSSMFQQL